MSMKRKRSTPSLFATSPIDPTPAPFLSSPTRLPDFFAQSKPLEPQYPIWKQQFQDLSAQDEDRIYQSNSRTRKRYRDGRPDEAEIHASTVQKLFSAQKAHPHAEPLQSQPQLQNECQPSQTVPQRSTLHSFWHLPQSSQLPQHGGPAQIQRQEVWTCNGCDRALCSEYGVDTIDVETACRACGKHVCDTCAVAAETRLCLDCAMQA